MQGEADHGGVGAHVLERPRLREDVGAFEGGPTLFDRVG
jgi:hypothetical protein